MKTGSSSPAKLGGSFFIRASQLWRFSLGSNAAILKKIGKCGAANAKELVAQIDSLAQAVMANRDTSVAVLAAELGVKPATLYPYIDANRNKRENGNRILAA